MYIFRASITSKAKEEQIVKAIYRISFMHTSGEWK